MKGLLQVSVAVLLDNFVQASADMEQEEDNRRRINALKFGPVRSTCWVSAKYRLGHDKDQILFQDEVYLCGKGEIILMFGSQSFVYRRVIWGCTLLMSQVRNPLDPFLEKLCKEFIDDEDLSLRLHAYFKVC